MGVSIHENLRGPMRRFLYVNTELVPLCYRLLSSHDQIFVIGRLIVGNVVMNWRRSKRLLPQVTQMIGMSWTIASGNEDIGQ